MITNRKSMGILGLILFGAGAATGLASTGVAGSLAEPAPRYSEVEFDLDRVTIQTIGDLGIPVDHIESPDRQSLRMTVSPWDLQQLQTHKVPYRLLVEDAAKHCEERLRAGMMQPLRKESGTAVPAPENFKLGSMGGYLTFNEAVAELDRMRSLFPKLISAKFEIGKSLENRSLWAVRISSNPDVEQPKPRVSYDALIHAREPMGLMGLTYFMWHLLESYETDPGVKRLLDNLELYFAPVLNPDGYEYNRGTNPNGGGMWRKNRATNSDGSRGVDPNRNFSVLWGDNSGSSNVGSSDAYRGPSAFSEPETKAVRDYHLAKKFFIMLHYHTPSNKIIHPYGILRYPTNRAEYEAIAKELVRTNGWQYGPVPPMVGYSATGVTTDWAHDVNKEFAFGAELGSTTEGFWPTQSRITPLAAVVLETNLALARAALPTATRVAPMARISDKLFADFSAAGDRLDFHYQLNDASRPWDLTVSDLQGRELRRIRLSPAGKRTVSLAQGEFRRSLYLLKVESCGGDGCRILLKRKQMLGAP